MDFNIFVNKIEFFKRKKLGGLESQLKLAPELRKQFTEEEILEKQPKKAAVLALFYPDENNNTCFLLTERAKYKGIHSSQICFPGGKINFIDDNNLEETALRETYEEIGIPKENITIIKPLSLNYIPPSNFLVSPFLGFLSSSPVFTKNYEVSSIIEILLEDLLDNSMVSTTVITTSYMENVKVPCFKLNNYIIWGATAMILSEIKDLLK